jgi:flagellar motor switch protein FliN
VTWAAKGRDLPTLARQAARAGIMLGPITAGSRRRPDGLLLSWQYTDPRTVVADGIVPFFIDWGTSPHPAGSAAAGAELVGLRALHSDPVRVQKMLAALEVDLPVSVSFGRAQLPLKDVLKLSIGSIVELNRTLTEPVEVIVNNCVIARGEVVVVEGNYGVRIQEVISREKRLRTLQ